MSRQNSSVFCLFVFFLFFISSCSSLDFVVSKNGKTPFKISASKSSGKEIEIESRSDFYFWGKSPLNDVIDLDDYAVERGLENPSSVTVSQSIGWRSLLYTIVTLGLYAPVDYKISLLVDKEQRN